MVDIRNLPRKCRKGNDAIILDLSDMWREEEYRTVANFKNLTSLQNDVKASYYKAANNPGLWSIKEDNFSAKRYDLWAKILRLRKRWITDNEEFKEALLCKGRKIHEDWPTPWWNYEEFRRTRRNWADFFLSDPKWTDHLNNNL